MKISVTKRKVAYTPIVRSYFRCIVLGSLNYCVLIVPMSLEGISILHRAMFLIRFLSL